MQAIAIVFLGAGTGGVLRHLVNLAALRWWGIAFPWGTFAINVTGSFVMGLAAGWLAFKAGEGWTQPLRLFLLTGVLGGYTTFSAFSLETMLLVDRGEIGAAAAYVAGSVGLAIGALALGLFLMRSLT